MRESVVMGAGCVKASQFSIFYFYNFVGLLPLDYRHLFTIVTP